jgi:hypothetical protein
MTPPRIEDLQQQRKDQDQIRLLSVFHYVSSGLSLLGIGFLFVHHLFFSKFMDNPAMWKAANHQAPPKEFFQIFIWFYILGAIWFLASSVLNLISGFFLQKRQHRTFSLVVAGINCLHFPLGTTLGVFTFIVLMRDSVRVSYEQR